MFLDSIKWMLNVVPYFIQLLLVACNPFPIKIPKRLRKEPISTTGGLKDKRMLDFINNLCKGGYTYVKSPPSIPSINPERTKPRS